MNHVTHTNRRGNTYYLCRVTTKNGRSRYVFAREPRGEAVEAVPDGYEIRESVNGQVSLRKAVPCLITPVEVDAVRAAVAGEPHLRHHRVDVHKDSVVVYGPASDIDGIASVIARMGGDLNSPAATRLLRSVRYDGVLRFVLDDTAERTFEVQRMCYLGGIDGWMSLHDFGPISDLAGRYVRHVGRESFYELM